MAVGEPRKSGRGTRTWTRGCVTASSTWRASPRTRCWPGACTSASRSATRACRSSAASSSDSSRRRCRLGVRPAVPRTFTWTSRLRSTRARRSRALAPGRRRHGVGRQAMLGILPTDEGRFVLAWRLQVRLPRDVRLVLVNAHTGVVEREGSLLRTQLPGVGTGGGVFGDPERSRPPHRRRDTSCVTPRRPGTTATFDFAGSPPRCSRTQGGGSMTPTSPPIRTTPGPTASPSMRTRIRGGFTTISSPAPAGAASTTATARPR